MNNKLDMKTASVAQGNIEKIRQLFPNAVTEVIKDGKVELAIDFDVLKQELSESLIGEGKERYQMTWPGKRQAVVLANTSTTDTLRPCKEESVNFDNTQNLYIEGDNLNVLKLLRETYLGKIKMIYIDPPYNTGNDFVYEDNFAQSADDYRGNSGQYDEQGNRLFQNTESNGRFHTDWLNMIYPRLKVARDLLSDDGVIFISIDDAELFNLKKVCDEVFGSKNFICNFIRKNKAGSGHDSANIAIEFDYVLCYVKDVQLSKINQEIVDVENDEKYKFEDQYVGKRGKFYLRDLDYKGSYSEGLDYPIETPDGTMIYSGGGFGRPNTWRWSKQKFEWGKENGFIVFQKRDTQWKVYIKQYQFVDNNDEFYVRTIPYRALIDFSNGLGSAECNDLLGNNVFSYPKPSALVKYFLKIASEKHSIILDFFSGSATTAHAVMQLNAEDGGNRKFIMVQLPEKCDEKSEAFKAGYKNICEIGKERIRRAGRKILELSLESLEKEGVIEKYAGKLSEIRSLEEVYGAGGTSLSADKPVAKRGNVRLSRPNATGSGFNSVEHSRRTGSGDTGIYPIFESGEGLTSGAGNTIVTMRSLEILNMLGYRVCVECIRGDQQNDIFSDYTSKLQALNSKLSLDTGFRVLKLDSSNMQDVYYNPQKISQTLLDATIDNVKPDRSPLDLLFQVMLELGVPLSAKIEEHTVNGKTYFAVNGNDVIACFDDNIDNDVITAIAKQQPLYGVFKDKSFASDSVAINNEQLFKTYSPTTIIKMV